MKKAIKKPKAKPAAKKPTRAKKDSFTNVNKLIARNAAKKPAAKKASRPRKPKAEFKAPPTTTEYNASVEKPATVDPVRFFRVTNMVVSPAGVFGLSSDNEVMRWDTARGEWKLHKEGE